MASNISTLVFYLLPVGSFLSLSVTLIDETLEDSNHFSLSSILAIPKYIFKKFVSYEENTNHWYFENEKDRAFSL